MVVSRISSYLPKPLWTTNSSSCLKKLNGQVTLDVFFFFFYSDVSVAICISTHILKISNDIDVLLARQTELVGLCLIKIIFEYFCPEQNVCFNHLSNQLFPVYTLDTGCKLNVHKTFNLRPVSREMIYNYFAKM